MNTQMNANHTKNPLLPSPLRLPINQPAMLYRARSEAVTEALAQLAAHDIEPLSIDLNRAHPLIVVRYGRGIEAIGRTVRIGSAPGAHGRAYRHRVLAADARVHIEYDTQAN